MGKSSKRENPREVNWRDTELERHEPDHLSVDHIRPRGRLRAVTLRLGLEQIAEARRCAAETGVPYQSVIRRWVASGAAEYQRQRRKQRK